MTSKPSSHRSAEGFTLVELLVASTLMLVVMGGVLSLSLSTRRLYEADQARTRLHEVTRASKDFLTVDIRQAGERLDSTFPALEVLRGEDLPGGSAGDPDELVVRRNLVPIVMNSCRDLSGTQQVIFISEKFLPPPTGCTPAPDSDGDGWPDDHKVWADYRIANGEMLGVYPFVWAYIYDPVNRRGESFKYWYDLHNSGTIVAAPITWQNTYLAVNRPRVYVLEERRYRVANRTLQIVLNGEVGSPINVVDWVDDFQLLAHFRNGPTQDFLGPADDWSDLQGIEIGVDASVVRSVPIRRSWSSMILPRNALN